jgi:hypothetical protein
VSYSVGQIVYTTATGVNGTSNHGVQQPYEIFTVGIDQNPGISLQLTVYPNPTPSQVTLNTGNLDPEGIVYQLFDMKGKSMDSQPVRDRLTLIPLEEQPVGMYILKVMQGNFLLKTFKIIKN